MENETKDKIEQILEENLKITKEIHEMTKSIKNYVTFQKILSVFYIILFVAPLILAAVYLPKFLGDYLQPYQELLNDGKNTNNINNAQDILNQAQKILNNK